MDTLKEVFQISDQTCSFCDDFAEIMGYIKNSTTSDFTLKQIADFTLGDALKLNAGMNHLDIGPYFDMVGDVQNYKFQDCQDILKNRKLSQILFEN